MIECNAAKTWGLPSEKVWKIISSNDLSIVWITMAWETGSTGRGLWNRRNPTQGCNTKYTDEEDPWLKFILVLFEGGRKHYNHEIQETHPNEDITQESSIRGIGDTNRLLSKSNTRYKYRELVIALL